MLVSILSDIHLEHYYDPDKAMQFLERIRPVEMADVLVLAGDIWSLGKQPTFRYLDEFRKWAVDIVYVPGNHEWYGTSPRLEGQDTLKALHDEGLRVLGPGYYESFSYDGIKFVGTTCWYPDNPKVRKHLTDWSDTAYIRGHIKWWEKFQLEERQHLWNNVEEGCIVVTHMLPTWDCVSEQYLADSYNCLFVSNVQDLLLAKKPRLWIHGHSHDKLDMMIGETRCVRNPIGYPSERTTQNATVLQLHL